MRSWVPIDKELATELPHRETRPFTKLEATFSLTLDYDRSKSVTIRGYAQQWRWSRGRVERFLEALGVEIAYPSSTSHCQRQRGQIVIVNSGRNEAESGPMKLIDSKWLSSESSRKRAESTPEVSRKRAATIKPRTYPNPKPVQKTTPPSGDGTLGQGDHSPCPAEQIVILYHETLPSLPRVRSITEPLRKSIRQRWRESPERQNLEWWQDFFEDVGKSDFLMGRAKDFMASLDWLMGPKNFSKVLNGAYQNRTTLPATLQTGNAPRKMTREEERMARNIEAGKRAAERIMRDGAL